MSTKKETQKDKILKHLKMFKSITPLEALKEYGCMRLAAVVFELKKDYAIATEIIKSRNRFGDEVRFAKYMFIGEKSLI